MLGKLVRDGVGLELGPKPKGMRYSASGPKPCPYESLLIC